jgi:hypothetical protein
MVPGFQEPFILTTIWYAANHDVIDIYLDEDEFAHGWDAIDD